MRKLLAILAALSTLSILFAGTAAAAPPEVSETVFDNDPVTLIGFCADGGDITLASSGKLTDREFFDRSGDLVRTNVKAALTLVATQPDTGESLTFTASYSVNVDAASGQRTFRGRQFSTFVPGEGAVYLPVGRQTFQGFEPDPLFLAGLDEELAPVQFSCAYFG